ncbi:hypothetical protein M0R04_09700 [Candidatus Dojkabacteria bacterium]|jgi:hypothetical protein|nr:hypothetical protein [Candidatus Dojkabacteria bacterium]
MKKQKKFKKVIINDDGLSEEASSLFIFTMGGYCSIFLLYLFVDSLPKGIFFISSLITVVVIIIIGAVDYIIHREVYYEEIK